MMQAISEIKSTGLICKPLHVKVLFKYPELIPRQNDNGRPRDPIYKLVVADGSGTILLIATGPEASQIAKMTKVDGFYLISAAGASARAVNAQYRQITQHPMELWINKVNKIQVDEPFENVKTGLKFDFTTLSRLSKTDEGCDIIAKVNWKGTESTTQDGSLIKPIKLEDESRSGADRAINCKLYGDHCKLIKKKGDIVVIHNAFIGIQDGDLVINVNNKSALFVVSNESDFWMLSESDRQGYKSLLTKKKSNKRASNENAVSDNEKTPTKKVKINEIENLGQNPSPASSSTSDTANRNLSGERNGCTPSPKKTKRKQETATILELKQLSEGKKRGPIEYLVSGVTISQWRLRRYLGCARCSKSLKVSEDKKFYCSGVKCRTRKEEEAEQKIYFLLNNIRITDGTEEIQGLVCFNEGVENLLGKPANEYLSDENAEDYLSSLIHRNAFYIVITASRKGPPGPELSKQPWEFVIQELHMVQTNGHAETLPEETLEVFTDDVGLSGNEQRMAEILAERKELMIKVKQSHINADLRNEKDMYPIVSNPRGLAILILIEEANINGHIEVRNGADEDRRMFSELFSQLHYKVVVWTNTTSKELASKIEECRREYDDNSYDSFVLGISSHGFNNNVQMGDGVIINLWTEIVYAFDNKRFPSLIGKPKIFILGFCQDFIDSVMARRLSSNRRLCEQVGPLNCDPDHTDMLFLISNSPGFKSYRSPLVGTHFFRAVAEVLMEHAHEMEIRQLFKTISRVLYSPLETTSTKKQIPVEISLLFNKDFYFRP